MEEFDAQEVEAGFWIGSENAGYCPIEEFQKRGITHVVVCGLGLRVFHPEKLKYLHLKKIIDIPLCDISMCFPLVMKFLEEGSDKGGVLFHCSQGISRSASFLAAYLMEKQRISLAEALYRIRKARPIISPNQGFLNQLSVLEKSLKLEPKPKSSKVIEKGKS
eukprot:TRINITY_DN6168_c0_g1_i1.p1 TRINITY_DN6168_c0_g1~~TRINITY_DN6168_c0_g1_i1.p1  ORF type:complete len:163 (-),score=25.56 TRINITY_DN6168_c0_g1_i1:74-562(-)